MKSGPVHGEIPGSDMVPAIRDGITHYTVGNQVFARQCLFEYKPRWVLGTLRFYNFTSVTFQCQLSHIVSKHNFPSPQVPNDFHSHCFRHHCSWAWLPLLNISSHYNTSCMVYVILKHPFVEEKYSLGVSTMENDADNTSEFFIRLTLLSKCSGS